MACMHNIVLTYSTLYRCNVIAELHSRSFTGGKQLIIFFLPLLFAFWWHCLSFRILNTIKEHLIEETSSSMAKQSELSNTNKVIYDFQGKVTVNGKNKQTKKPTLFLSSKSNIFGKPVFTEALHVSFLKPCYNYICQLSILFNTQSREFVLGRKIFIFIKDT